MTYAVKKLITAFNEKTKRVETHEVLLQIDLQEVADFLGRKALNNRSKKAKALHGAVVVTAQVRRG